MHISWILEWNSFHFLLVGFAVPHLDITSDDSVDGWGLLIVSPRKYSCSFCCFKAENHPDPCMSIHLNYLHVQTVVFSVMIDDSPWKMRVWEFCRALKVSRRLKQSCVLHTLLHSICPTLKPVEQDQISCKSRWPMHGMWSDGHPWAFRNDWIAKLLLCANVS